MNRYIQSSESVCYIDFDALQISSIVVVSDARSYEPKDDFIYDVYASKKIDFNFNNYDDNELLDLDDKILHNIHDMAVLRRLPESRLSEQQKREITQFNKVYEFRLTHKQYDAIISKLKDSSIYIVPRAKNDEFQKYIESQGGRIHDEDVENILDLLSFSNGYKYCKYSYDSSRWNAMLMVFQYKGSYTVQPKRRNEAPVTVDNLDIYIKIDVDNKTNRDYAAISFHTSDSDDE